MEIIKASTISDCVETASILASSYNTLTANKCFVFCEDKITLSLELEIAKKCGGGFFNIDVSTFTRYINSKIKDAKVLSKESSVMAVRKIILQKQKDLVCFNNLKYSPNLSVTLYELISQLASAKVTSLDLDNLLMQEGNLSSALANKLKDISLIYSEYKKYVSERGFYDGNDYLSLMPSLINNDVDFEGATVILVGFSAVTRQRAEIFETIFKRAQKTIAVIVADDNADIYTNETLDRLKKIDPNAKIENAKVNISNELRALKTNLFNPEVFKKSFVPCKTNKVSITEYPDVQTEVENVCKDIVKQVKQGGKRYKNIAVTVGNLQQYKLIIEKTFKEYGVPFYIDKSTTLAEHPICRYVTSFIDLTRKNLAVADVLNFVQNGMFCIDKTVTDKFTVYVNKYALTRKAFTCEFKYNCEDYNVFEEIRQKVYNAYISLDKASTVEECVNAVKNMFIVTSTLQNVTAYNEKLNNYGEIAYADFNNKILEKVDRLLDEMVAVLGNTKISLIDFKTVFLSGAGATNIGAIPLFNDAVYVGECKDVKIKRADVLYAVGINGNVPFSKSDTALLSDGDLSALDNFKIIVEPKIKIVNKREKENVCIAFMSFNDIFKLSYSNLGADGKGAVKSEIVNYVAKIFNVEIDSERKNATTYLKKINEGYDYNDEKINEYISDKYLSLTSAMREIASLNQNLIKRDAGIQLASFYKAVENIDGNVLQKAEEVLKISTKKPECIKNANLCLKGEEISATTLEEYFRCPYSNYVKNVISLKDFETGEMQYNEIGTMLHSIVENYASQIEKVTSKETSDALVEEITAEIFSKEDYAKYLEKGSHKYLFKKMLIEGKKACYDIYSTVKGSQFKPTYFEVRFGKGNEKEAISLNTKSGNYKIKGAIDRVDFAGDKVRVIDYKSGKTHPEVEAFYTGNNLQLYLYMNAFTREGYKPAGAYYFPIKNDYVNEDKARKYIMDGNTVDSEEVLKASDGDLLPNTQSALIHVKLKTNGEPNKGSSAVLTEKQMQAYLDYSLKIAAKGVDEINEGYVKAKPYKPDVNCKYCKYAGLCNTVICETDGRKVSKVTPEDIVLAVEYENDLELSSKENNDGIN